MSTNHDLRRVQSRINPLGGFDIVENIPSENVIDPEVATPWRVARDGMRFTVNARLLGRLEAMAKMRFKLAKLSPKSVESWRKSFESVEVRKALAQSVLASSEIEGEGLLASEVELFLNAATESPENVVTAELSERVKAKSDIYETYLWVLTLDRKSYINFDLVLELHQRMFFSSKASIAGRLKEKEVHIVGGSYRVQTLPVEKTPAYLRELCARTDERLVSAKKTADESMLFIVAEFICDFLAIHPFPDGNGRLARLLSTYLLERAGYKFARFYPLDLIVLESRDEYYEALFRAQLDWYGPTEDLTPWVQYYVMSIYIQCQRALQAIADKATS